jgi:hypothetical protein
MMGGGLTKSFGTAMSAFKFTYTTRINTGMQNGKIPLLAQ